MKLPCRCCSIACLSIPVNPDRVHQRHIHALISFILLIGGLPVWAEVELALTDAYASSWGIDERNTRYQPRSSLTAANVSNLQLKWTYGFANVAPRSYPLVTPTAIIVGDGGRGVVALARDTGKELWLYPHTGQISSPILFAESDNQALLIFADRTQGIYAIDAATGDLAWHTHIDDEPLPWYSGSPLVRGDTIYVPVSSSEVAVAVNPLYGCCTTSGGMAALNLADGKKRWFLRTIAEPAQVTGTRWWVVEEHGPSGATVWGAPSIDESANLLFFGTGQNYSHPTTDTSDAIFAINADTGDVVWHRQFTANDAYTAACNVVSLDHPNCPKPLGPDVDFGAATMVLNDSSGARLVIGGQKSAAVHAMDPTTGAVRWSTRLGRGGIIGGVHWGMAANEQAGLLYVPISDKAVPGFPAPGEPAPGLYALDIDSGEVEWSYSRPGRCDSLACVFGLSAAIIAANDIVVAGSIDGYLEIFDASSGEQVWSYDAWRDYDAVNGVPTSGGGFDGHGPMLADDLLIVTSGYGYVADQRPGNALLVFQLGNKP